MTAEQRNDFRDITETGGRGTIGRTICKHSAASATRSVIRHRGKNSPLLLAALLCSGCDYGSELDGRKRVDLFAQRYCVVTQVDLDHRQCVVCRDQYAVAVSCDWRER